MCKAYVSQHACVGGSPPMRTLLSSSVQLELQSKGGLQGMEVALSIVKHACDYYC